MPTEPYLHIDARIDDQALREHVVGLAWEAGASGVEERSEAELVIYVPASAAMAIHESLRIAIGDAGLLETPEPVEAVDWSERWKDGLVPIVISDRLVVRPSFVDHTALAGQVEIIIDPGQAFGTGSHASTRLVLEWVDVLCGDATKKVGRVLDAGTGSGVLVMAAVALGAGRGIGFDLDHIAVLEARNWLRENGVDEKIELYTGGIDALGDARFDLILANLLKREVRPLVDDLGRRLAPTGRLVLSGLLQPDVDDLHDDFANAGLRETDRRTITDESGAVWVSPVLERGDGRV